MTTEVEAAAAALTAALARKQKIRGGHRSSATRTTNSIDTLLADGEPAPAHLAQLKLSLEEKLSTLTKLDSEILDLTEDDDVDAEIQEADEFKDRMYGAIVRLENCSRTPTGPAIPPVTIAVTTSAATSSAGAPVVTTAPTTEPPVTTAVTTSAATPLADASVTCGHNSLYY